MAITNKESFSFSLKFSVLCTLNSASLFPPAPHFTARCTTLHGGRVAVRPDGFTVKLTKG